MPFEMKQLKAAIQPIRLCTSFGFRGTSSSSRLKIFQGLPLCLPPTGACYVKSGRNPFLLYLLVDENLLGIRDYLSAI